MTDVGPGVPRSAQLERTRRVYRHVAPFYDAFRRVWSLWTRPVERSLDGLFRQRIGRSTRILELAPGTGVNIDRLLRCAPEFASYLGIDSSTAMLERARRKARGDPRIELRLGDATDLGALDGRFDLLVCTWLLSHLDAPAETARDALSVLSPEGTAVFVFFTPARRPRIRRVTERLGGPFRYRLVDPAAIRALPGLERLEHCAAGMATLAVFRAPGTVGR